MFKFTSLEKAKYYIGNLADDNCSTVLVIGNFDGCHLGHKTLIKASTEFAQKNDLKSVALSFNPHPKVFFARQNHNQLLFDYDQKSRALAQLGIDIHVELKFDHSLASMSGEQFVHQILIEGLYTGCVFVGSDFKFAANRECTSQSLKEITAMYGVETNIIDPVFSGEQDDDISSSRIKKLLFKGDICQASRLLGHYLPIEGLVISGQGIGSKLGAPTANIAVGSFRLLKKGVYCGYVGIINHNNNNTFDQGVVDHQVMIDDFTNYKGLFRCVLYKGYRPSISPSQSSILSSEFLEVNVFDFEDLVKYYRLEKTSTDNRSLLLGKTLCIYLCRHIRSEQVFSSTQKLIDQIAKDIITAKKMLENVNKGDF